MTATQTPGARTKAAPPAAARVPDAVAALLPPAEPVRFVDEAGGWHEPADPGEPGGLAPPDGPTLVEAHRRLALGRRFNQQATTLTRQGRLAVYPSSHGQEACQVAAAMVLRRTDWLFPTYRDSVAVVGRGVDPLDVLTQFRGDRHCAYDPRAHRTAPQATPLATQCLHAAGLAHAARLRGDDVVALAMCGDGATSEGDFAEALNLAAVFALPVVFLVQNNGYAISVPLSRQTRAPSLAHKGVGFGLPGRLVDGNDAAALLAVLGAAVDRARSGGGPTLVEARTYRLDAHTNADDATRYRDAAEVDAWRARDPLPRLAAHLRREGLLDDDAAAAVADEADALTTAIRDRFAEPPVGDRDADADRLFAHVHARPTPQLDEQRALLAAEWAAADDAESSGDGTDVVGGRA